MSTRMEMDDETAALITQLQLQDSTEELERSQAKGKNVEGTLSDHQLALHLIQEDLKRHATILNDRKMAVSMRQAVEADAELLEASITQEQAELNDRREACRLGGVALPPLAIEAAPADNDIDDRLLGIMAAPDVEEPLEEDNEGDRIIETGPEDGCDAGESSQSALVRYIPRRRQTCVSCQEDHEFFNVTPVPPCGEIWCRTCLQDRFQRSFENESLWPPRCCQPILPESIRLFLTAEIIQKYEEKKAEYETPDRTYCFVPTCQAFLRPENLHADCGTCPACWADTCTICKSEWHNGQDCPSDTGLQLVLATADRTGWNAASAVE